VGKKRRTWGLERRGETINLKGGGGGGGGGWGKLLRLSGKMEERCSSPDYISVPFTEKLNPLRQKKDLYLSKEIHETQKKTKIKGWGV